MINFINNFLTFCIKFLYKLNETVKQFLNLRAIIYYFKRLIIFKIRARNIRRDSQPLSVSYEGGHVTFHMRLMYKKILNLLF